MVHNWISDEARRTGQSARKRNPPQKRETEREWAQENANVKTQQLFNIDPNDDFFYCHYRKDEQDVYKVLEESKSRRKLV